MYWTFILLIGDSTSDAGNVFQLTNGTWPISPPNYQGRYCNSYNWADDLEVLFKFNYAYGSATTDNNFVAGYAKANTVLVPVPLWIGSTVHIVWGSANDALVNASLIKTPQLIVASFMNSVKALLDGGSKTLIVFNQVPLQSIPINRIYSIDS